MPTHNTHLHSQSGEAKRKEKIFLFFMLQSLFSCHKTYSDSIYFPNVTPSTFSQASWFKSSCIFLKQVPANGKRRSQGGGGERGAPCLQTVIHFLPSLFPSFISLSSCVSYIQYFLNLYCVPPWKKSYNKPRQHIEKQRHYFASKGPSSQSYIFPVVMYGCES